MERLEGLSIGLDLDSMKINSGLKDLKSSLSTVNSEMKANMSAFDRSDKSIAKYETRLQGLNKKLEVQKAVTDSARKNYEKMVKEHGEGSKEAEKAAREYNNQSAALNNLERYVNGVQKELEQLQEEQRIASSNWTKFGKTLDDAGSKMTAFGEKTKGIGTTMSTVVTAPILAIGTASGLAAANTEDSMTRIQNSFGLTAEEAKELTTISRNIYKDGFGNSVEEIDNALIQTRQNIRDLNTEDLERITQKAFLLADTFESDVNEVTRAGNNLMKGFGIEADEAFDLMAAGAQNGLNFSNEMFDNLTEYSTLFGSMGFSAEEYFQLLSQGMEAGAYNLDYINDVMKEFQIRVKDGSDATKDAMGAMTKDTQKVWKEFLKGDKTVKDVSNTVLKELKGMDDQVKANEIGVTLFGTKWEDLESEAMYSLGGIGEGLEDVEGTMDDMTKNAEKNIKQQWASIWREAKSVVLPLGETLLDFTKEILPDVKDGIEDVSEWFSNLDEEGKKNIIMLAGMTAAAGPVLTVFGQVTVGVGALTQGIGALSKTIGVASGTGAASKLAILGKAGVAGLAIAGIAGVTLAVIDAVKESKELEEVNLDVAQSLNDQAIELESSAETFDKLSAKAKISNDELAELNDLNKRISESSNPGEINELQKQYDNLAKKSGLSKDELKELWDANDNIISQAPDVQTSISDTGNKFAENTDAVNEYIESLYESSRVELEAQRSAALEQEEAIINRITDLEKERNLLLDDMSVKNQAAELSETARRDRIEEINGLMEDRNLSQEEQKTLAQELVALTDLENGDHAKAIELLQEKINGKNESIEASQEELEKIDILNQEMANIVLKQAGINEEGEKGLVQLDETLAKNQQELSELDQKLEKNGVLNEKDRERRDTLQEIVGQQRDAKNYIFEELGLYNDLNSLINTKLGYLSQEQEQLITNLAKTSDIKVEEGNILDQLKKKNEKRLEEREQLVENWKQEGANKQEIQGQIDALDQKILNNDNVIEQTLRETGLWDEVKDQINFGRDALIKQGSQIDTNNSKTSIGIGREEKRTKEAGRDVKKNVDVTDNGTVSAIDVAARWGVIKPVEADDRGSIRDLNRKAASPIDKVVNFISNFTPWAKGTDTPAGHPGGNALLGDGIGFNAGSELVTLPSGKMFLSASTPTIYPDLPKGTQVLSAFKTKSLMKAMPKYADGTDGWEQMLEPVNVRTDFTKLLALLGKGAKDTLTLGASRSNNTNNPFKELLDATMQQNEILLKLLAKDTNNYLDGNVLANALEPRITQKQQRNQIRKGRRP